MRKSSEFSRDFSGQERNNLRTYYMKGEVGKKFWDFCTIVRITKLVYDSHKFII